MKDTEKMTLSRTRPQTQTNKVSVCLALVLLNVAWGIDLGRASSLVSNKPVAKVEAFLSCEQSEENDFEEFWYEVAIVMADGPGFELWLVRHDDKNEQAPILERALLAQSNSNSSTFTTLDKTAILKYSPQSKTAKFQMTLGRDANLILENMGCFEKVEIEKPESK